MSSIKKITVLSIVINLVGNALITLVYFEHKSSIQCEPCLPNYPCLPCQTEYMKNIIWYYIVFNIIVIVVFLILLKMNKNKNTIDQSTLSDIVKRQRITFSDDIITRINTDFGENADDATEMLIDAITKVEYLKTDRIIRCIIFLAKGNLTDLNKYIKTATFDTRDVMLWAEYEKFKGDMNYKRMRDFNKTFGECSNDVKE
jgi:hypothetical protein